MVEAAARRLPNIDAAGPWLRKLPCAARFILCAVPAAQQAAATVWPAGFSQDACRAVVQGQHATLWLGPEEYLLIELTGEAALPGAADFAALETAIGSLPHSLVDVSHRQFALELSGPLALDILSAACPLDFDLSEFPVGMCTRTVFAKADIVLWRTREDAFHVEVWRSFAGYVSGLMQEIVSSM